MASVLSRLDIPAPNYEQFDTPFDEYANLLDFTSATYVESELSEHLNKQELNYETSPLANAQHSGWAESYSNLDSESPRFDAVDYEIYRLMQDPQSDQTLFHEPIYSASQAHEDDWLVKDAARRAKTANKSDLCASYNKFVSEYVYDTSDNSIEETVPATETDHSELGSVRYQESPLKDLICPTHVQELEVLSPASSTFSVTKASKNVRFEGSFLGSSVPPSLSLSSDMEQFSPFGPPLEMSEVGVDPELLTLKDIPERPWLNGLELAEMNSWQRDIMLQAIGSTSSEEAVLSGKEPAYNESEIDPCLFDRNGTSLTGGTNLLCHPIYGICKETMAKSAALTCVNIPEDFGDKPPVVRKPDLHMNDEVERRYLYSMRKHKKKKEIGIPLPAPEPKYWKNLPSPSDCLFVNFRVKLNNSGKLFNKSSRSRPPRSRSSKSPISN